MDRHGLDEWTLRFNAARKKLGECRAGQKLISISRAHAVKDPRDRVTDSILHEIAHALAGPVAGHGPAWKAVARRLGAMPRPCAAESDKAHESREAARAKFNAGGAVSFVARGKRHAGIIVRMNPKRARVKCADRLWSVPYTRLDTPPPEGS